MEKHVNEVDYSSTVETLLSMFDKVLCKDAIVSIVDSCGGDLQEAANIIMNITGEDGAQNENQDGESNINTAMEANTSQQTTTITNTTNTQVQETTAGNVPSQPGTMVYREAILNAQASGAIPKKIPKKPPEIKKESKDIKNILKLHADGIKTLILMRGASGSGKTYLARSIVDKIYKSHVPGVWNLHILSTDDYFLRGGAYCFDRFRISEAHEWNQNRSFVAMKQGVSPVIIDNTNIDIWEMQPYIKASIKYQYVLILLKPNTPWANKFGQLLKRNLHNVSPQSLHRMLDNYRFYTSEELLATVSCDNIDSVSNIRAIPEFIPKENIAIEPDLQRSRDTQLDLLRSSDIQPEPQSSSAVELEPQSSSAGQQGSQSFSAVQPGQQNCSAVKTESQSSSAVQLEPNSCRTDQAESQSTSVVRLEPQGTNFVQTDTQSSSDVQTEQQSTSMEEIVEKFAVYKEVEKHLQEAAEIENEWDNGEKWDDSLAPEPVKETNQKIIGGTKQLPQRKVISGKYSQPDKLLSAMENVQDWTMFMPTWGKESTLKTTEQSSEPLIEKSSTGTSMEIGDTVLSNSKNPFKVITATPRDINEFFINDKSLKIPEKWMLDKSTSTINEVMHTPRCKNEEKHFNEFRKLFKHIPRADLRDIFDNCHGDVNWAVDIVLSDIGQKQSDIQAEELLESDNDDENCENYECDCVAAYNVIPDQNTPEEITPVSSTAPVAKTSSPLPIKRKIKKDNNQSDAFSQLKQLIEQNIVISDNHYSKHSLKIRKFRRGENEEMEEIIKNTENNSEPDVNREHLPSTSHIRDNDTSDLTVPDTTDNPDESDDETISTVDEGEKTISIDVTKDLMSQLDEHFGWKEMVYSSNISTKINVPISILNELNAIWIESLLFQMEENSKQLEIMVKQDEEFARQMAQKEAELLQTTVEPGIPDFKEIMDMDYALSLYHKDVAQWRNSEPSNLAAKLSRDKLNKLFPDLSEDSLAEILMAHDNNFKMTVEALLVSTGKSEVILAHNGVSKFIMDRENEQRENLRIQEEEPLSDSEWPPLPENQEVNMDDVRKYREQAEQHLKFRNMSHQKAQELMRRGMTPAARFYSQIAAYHKMKYETVSSYAAATLIHLHALNRRDGDTIDLHFLRVKEAREALDLFIDKHIQILRNQPELKHKKLFFITGRGLHSHGGPKIKPAVKKRLRERGLRFSETNPGLLGSKISAASLLANELG